MRRQTRGFTLIELMIVVAVVAILATIALPVYNEQVRKSRRSDAMSAAGQMQMDMERWRADHPSYAAGAVPAPAAYPKTPSSNFYNYDLAVAADGLTYELTAERKGAQADDRCGDLTVTQDIQKKPEWATDACNN